ncbi:PIN domain-containing protein [bacterium]|nr:MAG: PIN domain-containing protein [bacterium]
MVTSGRASYIRANYLDASAIIKVLVEEPDSSLVAEYFKGPHTFCMTSLCFAEALGVLKAKYFRHHHITEKGYLNRSYLLTVWVRDLRIKLDEVPLTEPKVFEEVEAIVKKYQIDTSDALQIVTIKRGEFSNFTGESQSLLITADGDLAKAARHEGLIVWDCVHEPSPKA